MPATKTAAKMTAPKKTAAKVDDRYFAKQPADKAALFEKLRALVNKGVPDADVSIRWGVPFYQVNGKNVYALASFEDYVAINFFAPPSAFVDPGKKLEGSGKGNRTLSRSTAPAILTARASFVG